jgi:hypothetical protein
MAGSERRLFRSPDVRHVWGGPNLSSLAQFNFSERPRRALPWWSTNSLYFVPGEGHYEARHEMAASCPTGEEDVVFHCIACAMQTMCKMRSKGTANVGIKLIGKTVMTPVCTA